MSQQKDLINWSKLISEYARECTFKECIFPIRKNCSKKITRCHSIQRKILDKISFRGKVISFDARNSYLTRSFEEIGIKKSSTFFGFCNYHDNSIFSEIENKDYEATIEQDFLFAYRACAKEYADQNTALQVQEKMLKDKKRLKKEHIPIIKANVELCKFVINNLSDQLEIFHAELLKDPSIRDYNVITSLMKKYSYEILFAVNSIISLNYESRQEKSNPLFLNIFPQNDKTYLILSCFSDDLNTYGSLFSKIKSNNIDRLEDFYSKIIVNGSRNLFISPCKWESLSLNIRKNIESTLINNMYRSINSTRLSLQHTFNLFELLKK